VTSDQSRGFLLGGMFVLVLHHILAMGRLPKGPSSFKSKKSSWLVTRKSTGPNGGPTTQQSTDGGQYRNRHWTEMQWESSGLVILMAK
jgi:hypothetical protein